MMKNVAGYGELNQQTVFGTRLGHCMMGQNISGAIKNSNDSLICPNYIRMMLCSGLSIYLFF